MKYRASVLFALSLVCGCGDDDNKDTGASGGSCKANVACGGDITGTWTITESCVARLVGTASCPGLVGDGSRVQQRGTVTYNSNGTYSANTTTTGLLRVTYPAECISSLSCLEVEQRVTTSLPAGYESATCVDAGGNACTCDFTLSSQASTDSGTYSTSGNRLTQMGAASQVSAEYCVTDKELKLTVRSTTSNDVSETFTLQRQ
ncbi:MAG: hypothetical protein ACOY0T_21105 [Myxococcota bacterium]